MAPVTLVPDRTDTGWAIVESLTYEEIEHYLVSPKNNPSYRRLVKKERVLDWVSAKAYEDFEHAQAKGRFDEDWQRETRILEKAAQIREKRLAAEQARQQAMSKYRTAQQPDAKDDDDIKAERGQLTVRSDSEDELATLEQASSRPEPASLKRPLSVSAEEELPSKRRAVLSPSRTPLPIIELRQTFVHPSHTGSSPEDTGQEDVQVEAQPQTSSKQTIHPSQAPLLPPLPILARDSCTSSLSEEASQPSSSLASKNPHRSVLGPPIRVNVKLPKPTASTNGGQGSSLGTTSPEKRPKAKEFPPILPPAKQKENKASPSKAASKASKKLLSETAQTSLREDTDTEASPALQTSTKLSPRVRRLTFKLKAAKSVQAEDNVPSESTTTKSLPLTGERSIPHSSSQPNTAASPRVRKLTSRAARTVQAKDNVPEPSTTKPLPSNGDRSTPQPNSQPNTIVRNGHSTTSPGRDVPMKEAPPTTPRTRRQKVADAHHTDTRLPIKDFSMDEAPPTTPRTSVKRPGHTIRHTIRQDNTPPPNRDVPMDEPPSSTSRTRSQRKNDITRQNLRSLENVNRDARQISLSRKQKNNHEVENNGSEASSFEYIFTAADRVKALARERKTRFTLTPPIRSRKTKTSEELVASEDQDAGDNHGNGLLGKPKNRASRGEGAEDSADSSNTTWEIHGILDSELRSVKGRKGKRVKKYFYLIAWVGDYEPTWEPEENVSDDAIDAYKKKIAEEEEKQAERGELREKNPARTKGTKKRKTEQEVESSKENNAAAGGSRKSKRGKATTRHDPPISADTEATLEPNPSTNGAAAAIATNNNGTQHAPTSDPAIACSLKSTTTTAATNEDSASASKPKLAPSPHIPTSLSPEHDPEHGSLSSLFSDHEAAAALAEIFSTPRAGQGTASSSNQPRHASLPLPRTTGSGIGIDASPGGGGDRESGSGTAPNSAMKLRQATKWELERGRRGNDEDVAAQPDADPDETEEEDDDDDASDESDEDESDEDEGDEDADDSDDDSDEDEDEEEEEAMFVKVHAEPESVSGSAAGRGKVKK